MSETVETSNIHETINNPPHSQQVGIMTAEVAITPNISQITSTINNKNKLTDGAEILKCNDDDSKTLKKRKRRRGKPKGSNKSKPFKKSNWKFQMPPRYRNRGNDNHNARERDKLLRSRCIVPYNTNKFLMEEHMAEVPSALLTPCGRTRDSSFSIDSEDNHFYSMAEDEEEFLTKEFTNVYERTRVERLENMSKQQLIEECLQLEDRYMQTSEYQHGNNTDLMNKIKFLEDKVRELNAENSELRRKLEYAQNKIQSQDDRMCCSSSESEDSESDSSTSSSSSSSSSGSSPCASSTDFSLSSSSNKSKNNNNDKNSNNETDEVAKINENTGKDQLEEKNIQTKSLNSDSTNHSSSQKH